MNTERGTVFHLSALRFQLYEFAGAGFGLAVLLTPISNPDLPWHLSAGQRILAQRSIPSSDWLSWTRSGTPWVDFEWGVQVLYQAAYQAGGIPGLFLLKALVLAALLVVFSALLRTLDVPVAWRGVSGYCKGTVSLIQYDSRAYVDVAKQATSFTQPRIHYDQS